MSVIGLNLKNYNNFISKFICKLNSKFQPNFITSQYIDIAH